MTVAVYDLDSARLVDSDNPYERYFDLIPVRDRELLPKNAAVTPTVHAGNLGELLGLPNLYLKNETAQPTGTTKYRMAAVSLPYLYECGVRDFCTSSTGNSSTAYATLIHLIPDLNMSIFTGSAFRSRVNYHPNNQLTHYILHDASFAEAFEVAARHASQHGQTSERGFFNLGRREGLKLAWLESVEQVAGPIDYYVQAVSSAMGVYGVYQAARESVALGMTNKLPALLCAQQESCCPMVRAWQENSKVIRPQHIVSNPTGIAEAILRGDPSRVYPYMREIVKGSGGNFLSASEHEIRAARKILQEQEGIDVCHSAATAVAATIKAASLKLIDRDETILINLTGSDRPGGEVPQEVIHQYRESGQWVTR